MSTSSSLHSLTTSFNTLCIRATRPLAQNTTCLALRPRCALQSQRQPHRTFTSSSARQNWLLPKRPERKKSMVGRPHVATGGSVRGTTVVWGEYGLRMKDHDRRISSKQLELGYKTIQQKLRGMNFKLYTRVSANIGVYTKGNEVRMGKGKGKFDYWCARVGVNRVVFEISGPVHEKVVREAFRLAGNKMPGQWETIRKGDAPVVGLTKLGDGVTLETLKAARRPGVVKGDKIGEEGMVETPIELVAGEVPRTMEGRLDA